MLIRPSANRFDLTLRSTEEEQRGQALDDVQEVPTKDRQRSPLTSRRLGGAAPDQRAEQWDERQRAENYEPGQHVLTEHNDNNRGWQEERRDQRRQVLREVVVDRIRAMGRERG